MVLLALHASARTISAILELSVHPVFPVGLQTTCSATSAILLRVTLGVTTRSLVRRLVFQQEHTATGQYVGVDLPLYQVKNNGYLSKSLIFNVL